MAVPSEKLNDAFAAYVRTFPSQVRLDAYIASNDLREKTLEINSELNALLQTAEDYLWSQEGGVAWSTKFEEAYEDRLRAKHPWITPKTISTILEFSKWLCWHEGLNAE